jgi:type I restriction enzyme M protein
MDKVSMKNQRGYEILIQIIALKIFDEKRSKKVNAFLDWHKTDEENEKLARHDEKIKEARMKREIAMMHDTQIDENIRPVQ